MLRAIAQKLLMLIPVLLIVSFGTFLLLELVPGDPAVAVLGADASPADYARVHEQLGLNKPLAERYFSWLGDAVTGDLGNSVVRPSSTVTSLIGSRLPVTLEIAALALGLSLLIAIPLGIFTAYRAATRFDRVAGGVTSGLISIPPFVSALLLIFLFVFNPEIPRWGVMIAFVLGGAWLAYATLVTTRKGDLETTGVVVRLVIAAVSIIAGVLLFRVWPDLPRQGFDRVTGEKGIGANLRSSFLPALTLALTEVAVFSRLLRNDMITTLQEDYVLSARAKGMPIHRVLMRDALRPSSFSLITLAGVSLGRLLGGTVIVETIFNLPGMGRLIVQDGVIPKDFTIVQGAVLVIAALYVLVNTAVDISYFALDPRIRRGRR
jgi:peptide/nickel transport system permease protein